MPAPSPRTSLLPQSVIRHPDLDPRLPRLAEAPGFAEYLVTGWETPDRRYIVCGVGHHLGVDVHDCARSSYSPCQHADISAGRVLTVEPGLYSHSWHATVPPELRGIGVRTEDDVLVTAEGSELRSDALPIDARVHEQWTQNVSSSVMARGAIR